MPGDPDVETTVRGLLKAAGLSLTEEQVALYVDAYPKLRDAADALWAIPEVRYETPADIYAAQPRAL
jgi:hypothetical protein